MKSEKKKSGENGMRKSKNKVYRWIAALLTAALLVGQCQVPVLANEGTAPVETGASDENKEGTQEGGADVKDKDAPKDGDTGNGGAGEVGDGADHGGGEGSAGNGGTDDGADSDDGSGGGDGSGNGGADDDGEDNPGDSGTGDAGENHGGEEGALDKCVCETACTEDAVNVDCPVCAADYSACTGDEENLDKTVSANDLVVEEDIALMAANEGVEVLAAGDEIIHDGIKYAVLVDGEADVEVVDQGLPYQTIIEVTIPGSFEEGKVTYRVTAIGIRAFFDYVSLNHISIPKGVTSIGASAFYNCGLRSLELPEGLVSIGDYAFNYCRSLSSDVIIPESVTSIGREVFHFCGKLMSIELQKGVTSIEQMAFCECISLTSVTVTENVEEIKWGGI